jgi:hypothetical protein
MRRVYGEFANAGEVLAFARASGIYGSVNHARQIGEYIWEAWRDEPAARNQEEVQS